MNNVGMTVMVDDNDHDGSLTTNAHSPIPIRRQLTEQLKHVIESGGVPPTILRSYFLTLP